VASYSHLSAAHRADARNQIVKDARILVARAGAIHYTQGAARWNPIAKRQGPYDVTIGDCSSIATWLLWRAIHNRVSRDIVNALAWRGGFTGTMLAHGKIVHDLNDCKVGDCAIFGPYPGRHVIVRVGEGRWLSHGSERGPNIVRLGYRSDLNRVHRYI
jgi:hypothetical protein